MEIVTKILLKSDDLFSRFGIKTTSMDDIAKHLGMSKKTIYKYIANKTDLVTRVLKHILDEDKRHIDEIHGKAENAILELSMIFDYVGPQLRKHNPRVLLELQRYYPEAWQLFEDYKNDYIYNSVLTNIKNGIEQGLYRKNFHPEIIAKLYIQGMVEVIDQSNFPVGDYGILKVYEEFITYHVRGIASEKGLEYLEKLPEVKIGKQK